MSRQIYAFRVLGDPDEPWYGKPDALLADQYETAVFAFSPEPNPSPFGGRTLEMRHGELPDDDTLPPWRTHTQVEVNGRPQNVLVRGDVAAILFPGRSDRPKP
jgi:hypothetical protein